jgi:hypothetical protein
MSSRTTKVEGITEGMATVLMSEYESLRREIDIYHEHQKEFMNFNIILTIGMLSLLGAFLTLPPGRSSSLNFTFLLFPIIFMLLSLFYTDRTVRIIRIADYLHNYLRPKANLFTGQKILQWELYKRHTRIFHRGFTLFLDRARWMTFIFPSILAVVVFCILKITSWTSLEIVLISLDAIAIATSFAVMFMTEETSGILSASAIDLDTMV